MNPHVPRRLQEGFAEYLPDSRDVLGKGCLARRPIVFKHSHEQQ